MKIRILLEYYLQMKLKIAKEKIYTIFAKQPKLAQMKNLKFPNNHGVFRLCSPYSDEIVNEILNLFEKQNEVKRKLDNIYHHKDRFSVE